ncbi:MAG: 5'-nucleotidase, lipoprotein e(P4) family [Ginsengibacter sp.]
MKKIYFIFLLFVVSASDAQEISVSNAPNGTVVTNGKMFATAYQQKSAEYRALCFQAFNIAYQRVDEIILAKTEKPKVIITDIDETILNNSPYEAHQTLRGKDYEPASWHEWTSMVNADTVPGSLGFLKYASSKGLEIFYVTNRDEEERNATLKNLQKFNFPNSDNGHLFPLQTTSSTSSKEERRKSIAAAHTIVMLMGDNLGDFSFLFDKKNIDERLQNVSSVAAEFGSRFIVLPNPVYGDWESSLYNYNYSLTPAQKDSVIKASLITY